MLRPTALAALAVLATCLACASPPGRATRIGTRPDGGSVMLSANNDNAWESAKDLMSSHCGGNYRIVAQVQEGSGGRGGPPPATPGAMAGPMGQAGAPFGIRIDYECTGGSGPLKQAPPQDPPPGSAPSKVPQTQTPVKG
jgi:hypothetical protein